MKTARESLGSIGSPCRVLLIRHAATNAHSRFIGQEDIPLSTEGKRQLKHLVAKVTKFPVKKIYSSDLQRTRETAAVLGRHFQLEVECRPALREMHFGAWQNLSWKQISQRFPKLSKEWVKSFPRRNIPEAERFKDFKRRTANELRRIIRANRRACVVIVTHAGVVRTVLAGALGMKDEHLFRLGQDTCALNVIDYLPDGVIVRCINA